MMGQISNIYQIDDNIIILKESSNIKIIKLKNNSLDIIQEIEDNKNKIIKLENSIISGGYDYDSKDIIFYLYEDYKLNKKKTKYYLSDGYSKKSETLYDFCFIKNDEIAIYYNREGKLFGQNAFLDFYDYNNDKIINTLKLGDGAHSCGYSIKLLNKNTLLLDRNWKIVIVDAINRTVKKEIRLSDYHYDVHNLILINEKKCIFRHRKGGYYISQLKIDGFNLNEKPGSISFLMMVYPQSFNPDASKDKLINSFNIIKKETEEINKNNFDKYTYEDLSKYNDARKGSRGYIYTATINPGKWAAVKCEHPVDLSQLKGNSGEIGYFAITPSQNRLQEPVTVIMLIDSCNAFIEQTDDLLKELFSKAIFD